MADPNTRHISLTYASVPSMWVVALHSPFLYSDPPDRLRLFSSQTLFSINTPTFSTCCYSYLPAYNDGTDSVF